MPLLLRTQLDPAGWILAILVRPECGQCVGVLEGVDVLRRQLPGYAVNVVDVPDDEELIAVPTPSAASIDPEGIVQGCGKMPSSEHVVAFVYEGWAAGIGPPTRPRTTLDLIET